MMDVTAGTEESGLAESAYELITPADSDPNDDLYTASIAGSVCSFEFQRPEDVHSLAGTEHTYDDESIIDDESEPLSRSMIHEEAVDVHNGTHAPLQDGPDDSEESESEEEARSRSSIEYTQHSLKTPSIATPEASSILERSFDAAEKPSNSREGPLKHWLTSALKHWLTSVRDGASQSWDHTTVAMSAVLPGFIFAALFTLLVTFLYPFPSQLAGHPKAVVISTVAVTTTPGAICTRPSTSTGTSIRQTRTQQSTVSIKGTGVIVLDDKAADEWLFGSRKPEIQFIPVGQGALTVHVSPDVTYAWLRKKGCLTITADRDTQPVKLKYVSSHDGFTVLFPGNETHGVVKLMMQAACRPLIVKAVEIYFGKGIMEEVYEMTKNFASNVSGFVPVAAQEAQKCLVGAKKSLIAASDTVASGVLMASDGLPCGIRDSAYRVRELVGEQSSSLAKSAHDVVGRLPRVFESMRHQLSEPLKAVPALETSIKEKISSAQVGLVRTQICAKMWWLGVTGQKNRRDEYGRKAKTYIDDIRSQGRRWIRSVEVRRVRNHTCFGPLNRGRCKKHEGMDKGG